MSSKPFGIAGIVSALLALGVSTTPAQQAAPIDTVQIDSIIRAHMTEKQIIGLSVGIMQNGRTVFTRAYGLADVQTRRPVTTQTMFAVGSVTKQFTCTAML